MGSSAKKWKEIFVSAGTIHIGNTTLSSSDDGGIEMSVISFSDKINKITSNELHSLSGISKNVQEQINELNLDNIADGSSNKYIINDTYNGTMSVASNFNVGKYFSTENPNGNLHVYGDITIEGDINTVSPLITQYHRHLSNYNIGYIDITNVDDTSNKPSIKIEHNVGYSNIMEISCKGDDGVFVIASNANIGINKLEPTEKLDIDGNVKISGSINNITYQEFDKLSGIDYNIKERIDNNILDSSNYIFSQSNILFIKSSNFDINSSNYIADTKNDLETSISGINSTIYQESNILFTKARDFNLDTSNYIVDTKNDLELSISTIDDTIYQESNILFTKSRDFNLDTSNYAKDLYDSNNLLINNLDTNLNDTSNILYNKSKNFDTNTSNYINDVYVDLTNDISDLDTTLFQQSNILFIKSSNFDFNSSNYIKDVKTNIDTQISSLNSDIADNDLNASNYLKKIESNLDTEVSGLTSSINANDTDTSNFIKKVNKADNLINFFKTSQFEIDGNDIINLSNASTNNIGGIRLGNNTSISSIGIMSIDLQTYVGDVKIVGDLTTSNLTILGDKTTLETNTFTTETLELNNLDSGTALSVNQAVGTNKIFTASSNYNEVFTIVNSGKIGINKSIPEYQLDVDGDINTKSVYKVDGVDINFTHIDGSVDLATQSTGNYVKSITTNNGIVTSESAGSGVDYSIAIDAVANGGLYFDSGGKVGVSLSDSAISGSLPITKLSSATQSDFLQFDGTEWKAKKTGFITSNILVPSGNAKAFDFTNTKIYSKLDFDVAGDLNIASGHNYRVNGSLLNFNNLDGSVDLATQSTGNYVKSITTNNGIVTSESAGSGVDYSIAIDAVANGGLYFDSGGKVGVSLSDSAISGSLPITKLSSATQSDFLQFDGTEWKAKKTGFITSNILVPSGNAKAFDFTNTKIYSKLDFDVAGDLNIASGHNYRVNGSLLNFNNLDGSVDLATQSTGNYVKSITTNNGIVTSESAGSGVDYSIAIDTVANGGLYFDSGGKVGVSLSDSAISGSLPITKLSSATQSDFLQFDGTEWKAKKTGFITSNILVPSGNAKAFDFTNTKIYSKLDFDVAGDLNIASGHNYRVNGSLLNFNNLDGSVDLATQSTGNYVKSITTNNGIVTSESAGSGVDYSIAIDAVANGGLYFDSGGKVGVSLSDSAISGSLPITKLSSATQSDFLQFDGTEWKAKKTGFITSNILVPSGNAKAFDFTNTKIYSKLDFDVAGDLNIASGHNYRVNGSLLNFNNLDGSVDLATQSTGNYVKSITTNNGIVTSESAGSGVDYSIAIDTVANGGLYFDSGGKVGVSLSDSAISGSLPITKLSSATQSDFLQFDGTEWKAKKTGFITSNILVPSGNAKAFDFTNTKIYSKLDFDVAGDLNIASGHNYRVNGSLLNFNNLDGSVDLATQSTGNYVKSITTNNGIVTSESAGSGVDYSIAIDTVANGGLYFDSGGKVGVSLSDSAISGSLPITKLSGGPLPISKGGTGATSAADARTALGVDAAGTDNSTNVTLTNTDYLTISGQAITAGTVPVSKGGTGASNAADARANLGVDEAGKDNSTNVTLTNTDYLTISGQAITAGIVPISKGGTGANTASAARTALGVDEAGKDNSTNVTLASVTDNYLSINVTNQVITARQVPISLGGTGASTLSGARTSLGISDVSLASVTDNYLSVSGNTITAGIVPLSLGGTGATDQASAALAILPQNPTTDSFLKYDGSGWIATVAGIPDISGITDDNGKLDYEAIKVPTETTIIDTTISDEPLPVDDVVRMYPPTRDLTSSSHTISGQTYGNGVYEDQSSVYNNVENHKAFSAFNTTLKPTVCAANQYASGVYQGSNYKVSDYLGDWIQIKFPVKIQLTKYGIKQRPGTDNSKFSPGKFKIYGSNDGTSWDELVHKSNTITYNLTIEQSNDHFEENVSINNAYQYFVLVVNELHGSVDHLKFDEWYIYGKELEVESVSIYSSHSTDEFIYPPYRYFTYNDSTGNYSVENGDMELGQSTSFTYNYTQNDPANTIGNNEQTSSTDINTHGMGVYTFN